jgi:hypothetical protein
MENIEKKIDLRGQVTLYAQMEHNSCAAAGARMCRDGFPNDAENSETALWAMMHQTDQEAGWWTDPSHVVDCLNKLTNPVNVTWHLIREDNRDVMMSAMLFQMKVTKFPALVLVERGGHWVVVVGWETDVEPDGGNIPTPLLIQYYDPQPEDTGWKGEKSGADWYELLWGGLPVGIPGHWGGKYVAIVAQT